MLVTQQTTDHRHPSSINSQSSFPLMGEEGSGLVAGRVRRRRGRMALKEEGGVGEEGGGWR
jgi:hypothetical protein